MWATTAAFLSDLQLESLEELPPLTELGELVLPDLADLPKDDEDETAEIEANDSEPPQIH